VATASDGEEGFRFYQEHQSRIGLLLSDVTMPNHRSKSGRCNIPE
jgi:YesN/AraC family two-component response regulator